MDTSFSRVRKLIDQKHTVKYAELTPVMVYSWLLDDESQKLVNSWSQEVLASVGDSFKGPASSSAASSSAQATSAATKKKQAKNEIRQLVSALW